MIVYEIVNYGAEKAAADNMAQNAKRMKQQADKAKAVIKVKDAQQKLTQVAQPIQPIKPL